MLFPGTVQYTQPLNIVQEAEKAGVRFIHCHAQGVKGGVTIAYRHTSPDYNGKMVEVAVAYCSPEDKFVKKVGAALAANRFMCGQTITVPAGRRSVHTTIENLRFMFTALI